MKKRARRVRYVPGEDPAYRTELEDLRIYLAAVSRVLRSKGTCRTKEERKGRLRAVRHVMNDIDARLARTKE